MEKKTRCTLKENHLSKIDGRVLAKAGEPLTITEVLHDNRVIVVSDTGFIFNIHTIKLKRI